MKRIFLLSLIGTMLCLSSWADSWQLISSASDIVAGETYLIATNNKTSVYNGNISNGHLSATAGTLSDDVFTAPSDAYEVTLIATSTANSYYIQRNGDSKYISATATKSGSFSQTAASGFAWAFSDDSNGGLIVVGRISGSNVNFRSYSNSSFRTYGNQTANTIYLYKKVAGGSTEPETPSTTTLAVPSNLTSANITTTGATLSWDAVENASSYTLKIGDTEYTNATSPYSATGLTASTQYTWTVKAIGDGTTYTSSEYATTVNFTTAAASTVFASLEDLVAADITSGTTVTVSFSNVAIKSFYTSGDYTNGVYFDIQKDGKDIEIYYRNVPSTWVISGTLSGTMTCPWTKYNGTWELVPTANSWNWTNLTYTAPAVTKQSRTLTLSSYKRTMLTTDDADEITVTCTGDGTLTATSSATDVATVTLANGTLTVTPVGAGSTTITVAAAETDTYYAATKSYNLTVTEPVVPEGPQVTFDLSIDETTTASASLLEWVNTNVTMTAAKAGASTATNNYYPGTEGKNYTSTRFYKSSTLTFTPAAGVTLGEIVVTTTSADYATALVGSTWTNATATAHTSSAPYTVTITPTDGTQAVAATMGATVGATGVVVNYTGTAAAALNKIELSGTYPTQFSQGDAFSHEGMIVTATYTDASTQDVSASATFSGYNMATPGQQTVTVSYTDNGVTKTADYNITIARQMTPATAGYETVDFTEIEPYASLTGNGTETVADYSGLSFDMFFAKPESSTTPTKYYNNGTSVRAYAENTITINAAENIEGVYFEWTAAKGEDTGIKITGLGTQTVVVTFSETCSFSSITVYYNSAVVKVRDWGFATYYNSQKAFTLPTGVEGYVAYMGSDNAFHFEKVYNAGDVVPANEALVLKAEEGNYVLPFTTGGTEAANNDLLGTDTQTTITADDNYYFYALSLDKPADGEQADPTTVGFYWMNATGAAFTNGAHKAYLKVAKSVFATEAPAHFSLTDETTAVENVEAAQEATKFFQDGHLFIKKGDAVYTITGQIVK